jgi:hypothetical protein
MSTCDCDKSAQKPKVQVRIVQLTPESVTLDITGCTRVQVNALRRACMADVRVLAIDETHVYVNTTGVHDETIGHRLGFVPLRHTANARLTGMCPRAQCTCGVGACPRCEVPLVVHFLARASSVHAAHAGVCDATHATSSGLVAMTSAHIRTNWHVPLVPVVPIPNSCGPGAVRTKSSAKSSTKHSTEHGTKHGTEHGTKSSAKSSTKHGTKSSAKHGTNHGTKHGTKHGTQMDETSQVGHRIIQAAPGSQFTALCKARVGTAADGAKWSAVSNCAFRVVEHATNPSETSPSLLAPLATDAVNSDAVNLTVNSMQEHTFRFTVETTGQLSLEDVLHCAITSLRCRLDTRIRSV